MATKPIRLEIHSVGNKSRVWYGEEDISGSVGKITIECEAGNVTRLILECFKLDAEPWTIKGHLLEDAE